MTPAGSAGGPLRVLFALAPRFLLLDYTGPAEAFRVAQVHGAQIDMQVCAPCPELPSSLGVSVGGLAPLPDPLAPDIRVFVTGTTRSAVDYELPEAHQLVDWLRHVVGRRQPVASICSGALLLARAGLLDGRRCTTHHQVLERLRAAAPAALVEDNRVFVEDGPVLTSAGITTGIDLALYLIERHCGAVIAARVAREMVVYLRRGPQDPQLSPWLAWRNHLHPAVHRAQDAIAADPARRWSVAELAEVACVSPRHLSRLFAAHAGVGVVEYQQQLRLARARELTRQGGLSLERVAELAGFGSARDLRRVAGRRTPA